MISDHSSYDSLDTAQLSRLEAFAVSAEAYCRWAEEEPHGTVQDARIARTLTAELFRRAIDLPQIFEDVVEAPEISIDEYQHVYRRFGALPFNYYSECFDPLIVPAEEPVTADLADDLADIWRDLKAGLILYQTSNRVAAAWQWRFHFEIHWGHHVSAAIYALQSWFSANSEELNQLPDRL
jgi:hypothetical protein